MASHSEPRPLTFKAGGTITGKTFVKFGADDQTVVAAGAGERAIGIAVEDSVSGDMVEVHLFGGGSKLKLAGTVTRGMFLKSDAAGKGVKATAAADFCPAFAMASGVVDDVIAVELAPVVAAATE